MLLRSPRHFPTPPFFPIAVMPAVRGIRICSRTPALLDRHVVHPAQSLTGFHILTGKGEHYARHKDGKCSRGRSSRASIYVTSLQHLTPIHTHPGRENKNQSKIVDRAHTDGHASPVGWAIVSECISSIVSDHLQFLCLMIPRPCHVVLPL